MITPEDARQSLGRQYERRFAQWAVQAAEGHAAGGDAAAADAADRHTADRDAAGSPAVDIPLHPPNEAAALAGAEGVADWIAAWRAEERSLGSSGRVIWESRRWANMGAQRLPVRLQLDGPADLAGFLGVGQQWRSTVRRIGALRQLLHAAAGERPPSSAEDVPAALRRRCRRISALDDAEFLRLRDVLGWLLDHPESGLYPRQLPVRGVDSKWLEAHRGLVEPLFAAATGRASLGLHSSPGLIRMRFLDPDSAPGGLRDLAAPAAELDRLRLDCRQVIVVENLQTLLALPERPDCLAVHGSGYAVRGLSGVPWLEQAELLYWGDLDVDGLQILSLMRARFPQTRSVLMDRSTLQAHRDLCVPDRKDAPRSVPEHLTGPERDAFAALAEFGQVRLEQERIPWETALAALQRALDR